MDDRYVRYVCREKCHKYYLGIHSNIQALFVPLCRFRTVAKIVSYMYWQYSACFMICHSRKTVLWYLCCKWCISLTCLNMYILACMSWYDIYVHVHWWYFNYYEYKINMSHVVQFAGMHCRIKSRTSFSLFVVRLASVC